jgi:hypothetical protein
MVSQRGSIVFALCLALGFLALFGGVYYVFSSSMLESARVNPEAAFDDLVAQVDRAMSQPGVMNASVERNPNPFACLYTTTADCDGRGGPFQIYEGAEAGARPLSQLIQDAGLTAEGAGCRGFPSEACPLRVEARWQPVCSAGARCEGTRSARIQVKVLLQGVSYPRDWEREEVITPALKLSAAVSCERGGGVWALTECLSHEQASQRQIASGPARAGLLREPEEREERLEQQLAAVAPEVHCPDQLNIQGQYHYLEYISPGRSQARTPAMNGCPGEDVFVFQCQPRQPDDREGQWIQVEAQMAPNCDAYGRPIEYPASR